MSYMVFCTFDLSGASSSDYEDAYSDLEEIGLNKVVISDGGKDVVMPTTSVIGILTGVSAGEIRTDIRDKVAKAFKARGFSSEIFILVGQGWAWGATTT